MIPLKRNLHILIHSNTLHTQIKNQLNQLKFPSLFPISLNLKTFNPQTFSILDCSYVVDCSNVHSPLEFLDFWLKSV